MQGHVLDYSRASAGRKFACLKWALGATILMMAGAFIFPELNHLCILTNESACRARMHQIGLAAIIYANNNSDQFPDDLSVLLATQDLEPSVFTCPATADTPAPGSTIQEYVANITKPGHLSYIYVGKGLKADAPADVVILYERLKNHANDGMNVLFIDGHVEWLSVAEAQLILKQAATGVRSIRYPQEAVPSTEK